MVSRVPGIPDTLVWVAAGGVLCGLGQGTREALMDQFGAQAGGDVLHRGGWEALRE